jgi:hypothetical protein
MKFLSETNSLKAAPEDYDLPKIVAQRDSYKAYAERLAEALESLIAATDHLEHITPQLNKAAEALGQWEQAIGKPTEGQP